VRCHADSIGGISAISLNSNQKVAGSNPAGGAQVRVEATAESVDFVLTALPSVGFGGDVGVADGTAEWPLVVWARTESRDAARELARRLGEPVGPLQRIGLVGDVQVAAADSGEPAGRAAVRIDDRIVVQLGEGTERSADGDLVLRVVPSLGFGSGLHPATMVTLRQIGRHARAGMDTLDLGCGNGIASVALAKLGARVVALDNDPAAVAATEATLRRNGVEERVSVSLGSLGRGATLGHWLGWGDLVRTPEIDAPAGFDLIAANILSSVHIGLADDYRAALRPNGVLITAGFTVQQMQDTSDALVEAGLECVDLSQQGDFVALAHRRPG
jgi:ribosomal protein L11 methyltransferase